MSYIPPLKLEQVIWIKPGWKEWDYTLDEDQGVSWVDVELDIIANSYTKWTLLDIRAELALMKDGKRRHITMNSPLGASLQKWIMENCFGVLQKHVDENFSASDTVTDTKLDERKHAD